MKPINIILFAFLLLFIVSCKKEHYDTYIIKNDTDFPIEVNAFDKYGHDDNYDPYEYENIIYKQTIKIQPLGKYIRKEYWEKNRKYSSVFDKVYQYDSVEIIFNNEKKIVQVCDRYFATGCGERSLMDRYLGFERKTGRETGIDYIYTITQEDYDNAEPIE